MVILIGTEKVSNFKTNVLGITVVLIWSERNYSMANAENDAIANSYLINAQTVSMIIK